MMGLNRSIFPSGTSMPDASKITAPLSSKHASGIRVLENVTFTGTGSAKPVATLRQGVDLLNASISSAPKRLSNMLLTPDPKYKTIKGIGATPMLLPMSHRNKSNVYPVPPSIIKHGVTKYITSKKQLLGRKPPFATVQKQPPIASYTNLPPPTNLTSQDIMDSPIIFADDNKMLTDTSELRQADIPVRIPDIVQSIPTPKLISNPVGKFVFLNKQQPLLQSLTTPALKKPALSVPVRSTANPIKYTKIIISRDLIHEPKPTSIPPDMTTVSHLSPDVSIRRVESTTPTSTASNISETMDLENKLIATTIPKPEFTITIKKETDNQSNVVKLEKPAVEIIKRHSMPASIRNTPEDDDDDPDYIPPKSVKLK